MGSSTIRLSRRSVAAPATAPSKFDLRLAAAPLAALLAGIVAEWLDFRALRYPLLAMVLLGVAITAVALEDRRATGHRGARLSAFTWATALGIATWAAAEALYVLIHVARGEAFDAGRFGPQWSQAIFLIALHAAFLGAPTGIAAAIILRIRGWRVERV